MVLFNSSQTRIIVLSSWKGKVHMWPHTQESNHMYVPLAQAFVFMPHTQIDESWNYKKLFHQIFSHNQVHMISKFIVQSVLVQVLSNLFFFNLSRKFWLFIWLSICTLPHLCNWDIQHIWASALFIFPKNIKYSLLEAILT